VTWSMGSSEAATVLGYDEHGSAMEVWLRALGRLPRYDDTDTPATRRGRGMESGLGSWFARERGFMVVPGPTLAMPPTIHPDHAWLHSRPDLFVWEVTYEKMGFSVADALAEVKTRRFLDEEDGWGEPGTAQVPATVRVQCLVHLACHPVAKRCYVVAFGTVEDDFRIYVVERDERRIGKLIHHLALWVDRHVNRGEAPPEDGRDRTTRALARGVKAAEGRVPVTAAPEDVAAYTAGQAKRSTRADLDHEVEKIRQRLMLRMGAATELVDDRGRLLATWRPGKDGVRRFRWRHELNQDEEG
jgi:hypothetical protein